MNSVVANRIKTKREALKLSTWELAELLGCPQPYIIRWERGDCSPSQKYWPKVQEWITDTKMYQFDTLMYRFASSQHPAKDAWFMVAESIITGCAIVHGGRCECSLLSPCTKLWDSLTEKCSDKLLTPRDLLEFIFKFSELQDQLEKAK